MDVQHAWNVALVVLSLLTVVLVISTLIITTCLRRENKMFYKRLARKSRISTTSNDLDMTELRGLLEKYTTVYCLSRDKIRQKILEIFTQTEENYGNCSRKKRYILELIR